MKIRVAVDRLVHIIVKRLSSRIHNVSQGVQSILFLVHYLREKSSLKQA